MDNLSQATKQREPTALTAMPKGFLCIDKPLGWTSFDVVKRLRGLLKEKKVGHAGTLDPLATGLLIVGMGEACKRLSFYQALPKTYEGLMCFGESRPSHDLETSACVVPFSGKETQIKLLAKDFEGQLMQQPPMYSAVKIGGKRAYVHARRGKELVLEPKAIEVHAFECLRMDLPWLRFRVCCSCGTYVRSLVRDLGKAAGTAASLHALRRVAIGSFFVEEAHTIQALALRQAETSSSTRSIT